MPNTLGGAEAREQEISQTIVHGSDDSIIVQHWAPTCCLLLLDTKR